MNRDGAATGEVSRGGSVTSKDGAGLGAGTWAEATAVRRSTLRFLALVLEGDETGMDAVAGVLSEVLLEKVPALMGMPRMVLRDCIAGVKMACFRHSHIRVEQMIDVILDTLASSAGNLVDVLAALVASFQSVSRRDATDRHNLGSVTSAHVRASDTLSTVATSAVMSYISSTGHMDDHSSMVGSHMDCASMDGETNSLDEEDVDLLREREALLEDEQRAAESEDEERRFAAKVCSYTRTSNTFSEQHW
ncbi:hypothetical protein T484DRAFT_1842389 [Baffinella frigidus]|nr:hypothetical protein T484DRAFT_1842389 [Cryptophyta sp. CCMP2293]